MQRLLAPILLSIALVAAASAPASARNTLVLKVDSVSAAVKHHQLTIVANGAVKSGGWDAPRLRIGKGGENGELVVHFVATPPARSTAVIQAMVPVKATLKRPVGQGAVLRIKVVAETNDLSVPVQTP